MGPIKIEPSKAGRGESTRQRILDAAERLLRQDRTDFSMRDLASEAGVSFATPFNHFGSKAAIMQALSDRRIAMMETRYAGALPLSKAYDRVLLAVDIAAQVMLEEPGVNRVVMGWLGMPGVEPGKVLMRSTSLWTLALGAGEGLVEGRRDRARRELPGQLAFAFRGILSFWTAGELSDENLATNARAISETLLLGFSKDGVP